MDRKQEYEKELKFAYDLWNRNMDIFDEIDEEYEFWDKTDPREEGHGFMFVGKKDKFQPIIDICLTTSLGDKGSISIFIKNRNGNDIIIGNTIAIYSMNYEYRENITKDEIKELDSRYRKMVKYSIDKWAKYNKENILGYVEKEERMEF